LQARHGALLFIVGLLRFCVRKPAMYLDDRWGGRRPLNVARSHPYTIHADGRRMVQMAPNVQELRPKATETEKITINLGYVDLGHVDLMVQDGFYSNRTDFIRTAIRNQLERHADVVKQSTARKGLDLGLRNYSREDLEAAQRAGEMLHINVLGLASIAQDVTADLARATIASVSVLGALHATPAVKAALADRIR
jgi:Arc/MetJ-type ribon-helix-helix transcriptional regulator